MVIEIRGDRDGVVDENVTAQKEPQSLNVIKDARAFNIINCSISMSVRHFSSLGNGSINPLV